MGTRVTVSTLFFNLLHIPKKFKKINYVFTFLSWTALISSNSACVSVNSWLACLVLASDSVSLCSAINFSSSISFSLSLFSASNFSLNDCVHKNIIKICSRLTSLTRKKTWHLALWKLQGKILELKNKNLETHKCLQKLGPHFSKYANFYLPCFCHLSLQACLHIRLKLLEPALCLLQLFLLELKYGHLND